MLDNDYNGPALQSAEIQLDADLAPHYVHPARPATRSRVAPERHPALVIALHWGTAVALVVAVGAMFVRDAIEDNGYRTLLLQLHRQLGLLVLLVAVWRLVTRFRHGLADHAPDMAWLLRWAARAAHVGLYALLLALPVLGWALTNAHETPLRLFGVIPLPAITAPDSEFADTLYDYHVWLAWGMLAMVVAHAGAALWHHFVRRDKVLSAMLPGKR